MDHNRRTPQAIQRQDHIDPDGEHEVWRDQHLRAAYKELFGEAVADYNARVRRDRRISDYLRDVCEDQRRHPVYEAIVAIGSRDQAPDPAVGKSVLRAYVNGWEARNPHLALIGAYYHADEAGVPHVHIDYVPWGEGYVRGPERQVALDKALRQQGIQSEGRARTAQMAWQDQERAVLAGLCRERGIEVYTLGERREHLATDAYKAQEAARAAEARLGLAQDAEGRLQAQKRPAGAKVPLADAYIVSGDDLQELQGQAAYRAAERAELAEAQRIKAREEQIVRAAEVRAEEIIAQAREQAKAESIDSRTARAKAMAELEAYKALEARHPEIFAQLRRQDKTITRQYL